MLVVSHDLIRAVPVADGQRRAVQGDFIEIIGQTTLGAGAAHTLQTLLERLSDGLRLGFAGQFREQRGQLLGLPISNVEWHTPSEDFFLINDLTSKNVPMPQTFRLGMIWRSRESPQCIENSMLPAGLCTIAASESGVLEQDRILSAFAELGVDRASAQGNVLTSNQEWAAVTKEQACRPRGHEHLGERNDDPLEREL